MLSPDSACDPEPLSRAAADYAVVRRAIAFVSERWRAQPEIDAIAAAAGVSADELHHLFRRWAAITPKAFLQALTLEHARRLLRDSASVLDATFEVGLSSPGRLHDLFVTHEAMSPGEWKSGGDGLTMSYGFHPSPFGTALIMMTRRGLAGVAFADPGDEHAALSDMKRRWPKANTIEDFARTTPFAPDLRYGLVASRAAVTRGAHRHRFRGAGVGSLARNSHGPRDDVLRHRDQDRRDKSRTRRGRCSRQEPALVRGAMPSRTEQARRAYRLSLGTHA